MVHMIFCYAEINLFCNLMHLFILCREGTFLLFIGHFNKEGLHILSELRSHPRSQFLYLKTVIEVHLSGTLNFSSLRRDDFVDPSVGIRLKDQSKGLEAYLEKISDFPKLIRNDPVEVTDDMIELYLEVSTFTTIFIIQARIHFTPFKFRLLVILVPIVLLFAISSEKF